MCAIKNCNFEGVTFVDFGKRENNYVVFELVCKYHYEKKNRGH